MVPFWVMYYSLCFSYLFVSLRLVFSWEPVPGLLELIAAYKASVPMELVGFEKLFPSTITELNTKRPHRLEKGIETKHQTG